MIKLLVTDIDGTLITDDGRLTEENKRAIRAAREKGVTFVLATGRMHVGAAHIWRELGLDTPIISYQGALIYDFIAKKSIFSEKLDKANVLSVLEFVREYGLYTHVYDDDVFYRNQFNRMSERYEKATRVKGELRVDIENAVPEDGCPKVLIMDASERMPEYIEEAKKRFGDRMEITCSNSYMLEFMKKGISKGRAVRALAEKLGVKRDEILTCGDGLNDVPLIEAAGIGAAVANAVPELKRSASIIIPSNNDNALADVIDRFILKKKGEKNG